MADTGEERRPVTRWRDEVRGAMGRGEFLEAYDLAEKALEENQNDPQLRWLAILALARAGATAQARKEYERSGIREAAAASSDHALAIDVESLDARIIKNEAFEAHGAKRTQLLAQAASSYEAIFRRTSDYYPGINAASLTLLAGDGPKSEALAVEVVAQCKAARERDGHDSYYVLATEAEAALVLGHLEQARAALEHAAAIHGGDLSAIATTRRQLKLVCDTRGIDQAILAPLTAPSVIHYSGHMIGRRFPPSAEPRMREQIAAALERHSVGFGYGSLAAGSDILFAEELLRRGAEVNVAMPFNIDDFKRVSVAPAGEEWLRRFDACLIAAKSVTYATSDEYLGDDSLFGYASRIAMGLALLRARFLDTNVRQIAIWDGAPVSGAESSAGSAADVAFWRERGLPGEVIDPREDPRKFAPPARTAIKPRRTKRSTSGRSIRAMLFGDVKGFSTLREAQLPIFAREILGRFARIIERHRANILFRNTWGDGLYVVAADVEAAARCAIELQEDLESFVPAEHGLPEYMALRIGAHFGPVFCVRDPVLKKNNYIGAHVSRAARIEPVTPEGAVYVTEAFAAALTIANPLEFVCEYVGQVPAAKHYGTMRMYLLRRVAAG